MIVAGVGCRKGVNADQVLAALDAALAQHGLMRDSLNALATTAFKREEAAIFAAGAALGLQVVVVETLPLALSPLAHPQIHSESTGQAAGGCQTNPVLDLGLVPSSQLPAEGDRRAADAPPTLTRSALSLATAGTPSVSESAALAAAGPGAQLLGPRTILGPVTCAIAVGGKP